MWCLIRFHWGVCHYFISRAIWRASVSCWKTWWLRGEQWTHWQQSVKAAAHICERVLMERRETEREICGAASAGDTSYSRLGSQYQLSEKMYELSCERNACPWAALRVSVLWGWHTREGFQLLPSRRHCMCVLSGIHWESTLFAIQHLQYCISIFSERVFVAGLLDVVHWWQW